MTYFLKCDEPVYYRVDYIWTEEGLERDDSYVGDADGLDNIVRYYWITSTDREEVLKVPDIMTGEELIQKLTDNENFTFERAAEEKEYAEIQENRPPF